MPVLPMVSSCWTMPQTLPMAPCSHCVLKRTLLPGPESTNAAAPSASPCAGQGNRDMPGPAGDGVPGLKRDLMRCPIATGLPGRAGGLTATPAGKRAGRLAGDRPLDPEPTEHAKQRSWTQSAGSPQRTGKQDGRTFHCASLPCRAPRVVLCCDIDFHFLFRHSAGQVLPCQSAPKVRKARSGSRAICSGAVTGCVRSGFRTA